MTDAAMRELYQVVEVGPAWYQENIPCQEACPVKTNCRGYLNLAAAGEFEKGWELALDPNPMASICGSVCAAPCETACRRKEVDKPLSIRYVKKFLSDWTHQNVTVGHFWTDRPYNVYHWLDGGRTVALYLSIATDTTIEPTLIAYRDLVVDVLFRPSGALEILDEDELPPSIEPRYRLAIAKALETCITEGRRLSAEIERETRAVLRT